MGKAHVSKITWTNVLPAKASIRFERVSVGLLGCVEISMKPSGWLGPGITCTTKVAFKPEVRCSPK